MAASVANAALAPYAYSRWDRVGDVPGYVVNLFKAIDIATDLHTIPKKMEVGWVVNLTQDAAQQEIYFNFDQNFWPCTCIVELVIGYQMTFANGITAEASTFEFNALGAPFTTANVSAYVLGIPVETTSGPEAAPNDVDVGTLAVYRFTVTPSAVATTIGFALAPHNVPFSAAPSSVSIGFLEATMISSTNFVP